MFARASRTGSWGADVSDRRLRHADSDAFDVRSGTLSAGVTIIACGEDERTPAARPPRLRPCRSPRRPSSCASHARPRAARPMRETHTFSISLLAARHQALAHRFGGQAACMRARPFDTARWTTLSTRPRCSPMRSPRSRATLVEEVIRRHLPYEILLGAVVSLKEGPRNRSLVRLATGSSYDARL